MGEVWLGTRTAMGSAAKVVAVKLLSTTDKAARDNFVKEAKLSMLLRHSTIVQVNDVAESQGTCFMEMEWVDGLDLSQLNERLREREEKLTIGIAAYVIGELLKALAFAHALDVDGKRETIVHRDVTPQNVLISKSGEVKLTDFGIAFLTSDKSSNDLVKGKSRYMSPEHMRQVREPCIDIFGVGAIFHEMLDGRKFRYTAKSDVDLWSMAFSGYIPPLPIALPAELEELRRGLLALNVEERFPSARAALSVLRRWPGYRDASEDIEELVRDTLAADVPLVATEQLVPISSDLDESTAVDKSSVVAQAEETDTDLAGPPKTSAAPATRQGSRNNRMLVLAFALVGLGFGGFGLNVFLNGDGGNEASQASRDVSQPSEPPTKPAELEHPAAEPTKKSEPSPAAVEPTPAPEPPKLEPQPVIQPPPGESSTVVEPLKPTKKKNTPKPPPKAKIEVTLTASNYPWVNVRVGSTTPHIFESRSPSTKTIAITPGKHEISYRIDDGDPWKSLGKFTIPDKPNVRVELRKPERIFID